MNTSIQKKANTLRDVIVSQRNQIAMALPKHMDVDRLIRVSITALRNNPRLLSCSQVSVLGSIIQAAQLGLETDGALGHAYLVPYKNQCQLQIGYRGMIDLARRSGQIVSISARVVYDGDEFSYSYGLEETLVHRPKIKSGGEPIAAYAVAKLVGGGCQFEVLSLEEIEAAHDASPASSGPWDNYWSEMARKTAVRRLFKYLPVSVEIQKAVGLSDMASAGVPQHLETIFTEAEVVEAPPDEEPPKKAMAKLTEKLQAQAEPQEGKPEPVTVPADAFDAIKELHDFARQAWGKEYEGPLSRACETGGYKLDTLTEEQAGNVLDVLTDINETDA